MSKPRRRTVVIGSVAVVAAAITITAINMSSASQPGDNAGLTAVNGSTIQWDNGTAPLTISDSAGVGGGGAWSPDGSRFAYTTTSGDVHTVRFTPPGSDIGHITDGESTPASHPTWTEDGVFIVWSEGGKLEFSTSDSFSISQDVLLDTSTTYSDPDGGPGGIVFTAGTGASAQIEMITEDQLFSTTQVTPTTVTAGTQPSLSIDGTRVAFVKSDGTNDQVWTTDLQGGTPVQVTSDAANHSNPTWSPDGETIAFNDGAAVATAPADGSGAANPTTVAGLTGAPAYQSTNADAVFRVFGTNRAQTAVMASQLVWDDAGQSQGGLPANAVVLSRSDMFADALGGAALAAAKDGPLLLTPPTSLNADTKNEILRILPKGKTVYILGGTGAISASVENQIKTLGYATAREAGTNRFETAVAIAKAVNPSPAEVLVSTGNNFPDALSAGAAAAAYDFPGADPNFTKVIILTSDTNMPAASKTYLDAHKSAKFYGVGGQAATALDNNGYTETPLFGTTRYDTSAIVAKQFFATNFVGLATGNNWPDALAGGAMMGEFGGPLVLTSPFAVQPPTNALFSLSSGSYGVAFAFGGTAVVPDKVLVQLGATMSGPDGAIGPVPISFGAAPMAKRAASVGGHAIPRATTAHRDLGHLDAKKSASK